MRGLFYWSGSIAAANNNSANNAGTGNRAGSIADTDTGANAGSDSGPAARLFLRYSSYSISFSL